MTDTKKANEAHAANDNSKKKTRKQIQKKLETALSNLRPILGDKKFKRRIKKAGKVLSSGLKNINNNGTPKTRGTKAKTNIHSVGSTHQ